MLRAIALIKNCGPPLLGSLLGTQSIVLESRLIKLQARWRPLGQKLATRSKIIIQWKRSWNKYTNKERTCKIRKPLPPAIQTIWPRLNNLKSRSSFKVRTTRSKLWYYVKVLSNGIHICNWKPHLFLFESYGRVVKEGQRKGQGLKVKNYRAMW